MSIGHLTQKLNKDPELSMQTVQSLDQRILEMQKLVTLVESRFPTQRQF
jgi:hypothetical protein